MLQIFHNLYSDAKHQDRLATRKRSNCSQKYSALDAEVFTLLWLKTQNQSGTQHPCFLPSNHKQIKDPSYHLSSRHVSPLFPNSPYSKANLTEEEPNHKLHYTLCHSRQVNKQGSDCFFQLKTICADCNFVKYINNWSSSNQSQPNLLIIYRSVPRDIIMLSRLVPSLGNTLSNSKIISMDFKIGIDILMSN